jgi:hypothetical protein
MGSAYHMRDSPHMSPSESHFPGGISHSSFGPADTRALAQTLVYDDPRTPYAYHEGGSSAFSQPGAESRDKTRSFSSAVSARPNLLRQSTDDGIFLGRSSSQAATPRPRKNAGPDRAVRVNLFTHGQPKNRKNLPIHGSGTRLATMAQGPEGRYVVGGGQCELPRDEAEIRLACTACANNR